MITRPERRKNHLSVTWNCSQGVCMDTSIEQQNLWMYPDQSTVSLLVFLVASQDDMRSG